MNKFKIQRTADDTWSLYMRGSHGWILQSEDPSEQESVSKMHTIIKNMSFEQPVEKYYDEQGEEIIQEATEE